MENNQAFVAYLKNIQPIPGADKIKSAHVVLHDTIITTIVTGADTEENTKIVYFDSNLCLSPEVLKDYPELNTYLGKNGRVRVVKLRGQISNGLAVPVEQFYKYLKKDPEATLKEGYSFTELGSTSICSKYIPPIKHIQGPGKKKGRKGRVESRVIKGQWAFHVDTEQLLRNLHKIKPESVISISSKIHGTSSIVSNALVKRKKNILEALAFWDTSYKTEYAYLYASRTVIKNDETASNNFYDFDIWRDAGEKYFKGKLAQGETVYYEIVGYLPSGSWIQKGYDYRNRPGEYSIAVYRITQTAPDGHVVEHGWQSLKERCAELGVPHVKEFFYGRAQDLFPELSLTEHWSQNFAAKLQEAYLEKMADCTTKVPDEGIVLRVERNGIEVYKMKSEKFYLYESEQHEKEVMDIEEGA